MARTYFFIESYDEASVFFVQPMESEMIVGLSIATQILEMLVEIVLSKDAKW